MKTLGQVLGILETVAPARYAFPFDKVGLQVGDVEAPIERAVVSLDRSLAAVEHAKACQAQLLLAHHPLIFRPLDSVTLHSHVGRTVSELVRANIAFVAAHTNWDSARGGINDKLATMFDLANVTCFGMGAEVEFAKIAVTAPATDAERILAAAAEAGAGVLGMYSGCSFSAAGVGRFTAGSHATPTAGKRGEPCQVDEIRIEMSCLMSQANAVSQAIRAAHSYEDPSVDIYLLRTGIEQSAGRLGDLPQPLTLRELVGQTEKTLNTKCWAWGDPDRTIRKVAFVGGGADDEWTAARTAGADILITGEVKQHNAVEASESGLAILAAGHYATEHPGCIALRDRMERVCPEVEWVIFEPAPGLAGRPF